MSISVRLARPEWAVSIANGLHEAADARAASARALAECGSAADALLEIAAKLAAQGLRGMEAHYRWLADQFGEAAERLPVPSDGGGGG